MYSFIVTHRNRPELLDGYKTMLRKFHPIDQLIVVEQGNDLPFMQGQLFNLGFTHAIGDMIILMDIDMRFTVPVNFYEHMKTIQKPFMGYDKIINIDANGNQIGIREMSQYSHGGCCVFTRKQFEDSCGYSNLMCWWGAEDDILNIRVGGFRRIHNTLHHVQHERSIHGSHYDTNVKIYHSEKTRRKELDGYKQTVASLIKKEQNKNTLTLVYDKISVVPDYKYRELLREVLQ